MSSKQSLANKIHYEMMARVFSGGPVSAETLRDLSEVHWAGFTVEAGDVDYTEVDAGGASGIWVTPKDSARDRAIFYAYGVGFVGGSIYAHRKMVGHLAKAAGCRALVYHYPLAHEHKHPKQLDVAVAAYLWLLSQGHKPQHVALGGDSCGAILSIGLLQRARDASWPMPAAVILISGWFDLTLSAGSFVTNGDKDPAFSKSNINMLAANFLGEAGDRRDPYASPLHADPTGFPPM
jgi:epsilon-lactone hydrolase